MASKRGKSAAGGTLDPEQGALRHQGMTPLPRDNMGSGMSGRDAGHKQAFGALWGDANRWLNV